MFFSTELVNLNGPQTKICQRQLGRGIVESERYPADSRKVRTDQNWSGKTEFGQTRQDMVRVFTKKTPH